MAAREVRLWRNTSKRCVANEMRSRLLEALLDVGVGLREMEEFLLMEDGKRRGVKFTKEQIYGRNREIIKKLVKGKLLSSY